MPSLIFGWSCVEPAVRLADPYGSLPTRDVLSFHGCSCLQHSPGQPQDGDVQPPPEHSPPEQNALAPSATAPLASYPPGAAAMRAANSQQPAGVAEEADSDGRSETAGGGQPRERPIPSSRPARPTPPGSPVPAARGCWAPPGGSRKPWREGMMGRGTVTSHPGPPGVGLPSFGGQCLLPWGTRPPPPALGSTLGCSPWRDSIPTAPQSPGLPWLQHPVVQSPADEHHHVCKSALKCIRARRIA